MADNDTTTDERPSPIPTPPDFPVVWENPEDEGMFWQSDMMHFPEPTTPLMDLWERAFNQGFVDAAEASEVPIVLMYRRINTWEFNSVVPRVPPEEMEPQGRRGYEHIRNDVGRLWEWWTDDLLPEIQLTEPLGDARAQEVLGTHNAMVREQVSCTSGIRDQEPGRRLHGGLP